MSYYTPYKVKGFEAWFDGLAHASDELTKIGQMKQDAMKVAGTWPADELLASLDEKERLQNRGECQGDLRRSQRSHISHQWVSG